MKVKFIAKMLLTLSITCFSSLTSFSAAFDEESIIQQAIALRDDIERIANLAENNDSAQVLDEGRIVVLGKTGCGKTTLVAGYAVGLRGELNNDGVIQLVPASALQGFEPRYGAAVGTRFPTPCYDPGEKATIWDCPGLGDRRGPKDDILNAFAIDKLFEGSPVKVVLVMNDIDLDLRNNRGANFYDLINQLVKLFPEKDQLQDVLSVVVTQGDRIMPHVRINSLLREVGWQGADNLNLSPDAVSIIDFLHREMGRVASLPQAIDEGPYQFDRKQFVDSMRSAKFLTNLTVDFKAGLSAEAKLLVVDYAKALNDFIVRYMKEEMTQKLVDRFNREIDRYDDLSNLREKFRRIKASLQALRRVPRTEPLAVVDILESLADTTELKKTIDVLIFLKRIRDSISIDVGEWVLALLNNVEPMLDKLSASPQIAYDDSSSVLTVNGLLVSASDINTALSHHSSAKQVNGFVLSTLWIDEDITAHKTSMNLVSPQWKIIGKRKIDLSGCTGFTGGSGSCGYPGQPGGPGDNGGHFYGKGSIFYGLENLTVNTDGGNGGCGGNGGKGYDGSKGNDGDPYKETHRGTATKSSYNEVNSAENHTTVKNKLRCHFEDLGTAGSAGGNGYSAGCGGLGGLGGCCIVVGGDISSPSIGCQGERGHSGYPGEGGKGGEHGKDCRGIQRTGTVTTTSKYQRSRTCTTGGTPQTHRSYKEYYWVTETETTTLPEKWKPRKHFKERSPSHAPDGAQGLGVNDAGLAYPLDQIVHDALSVTEAFSGYRSSALNLVDMNPFVRD